VCVCACERERERSRAVVRSVTRGEVRSHFAFAPGRFFFKREREREEKRESTRRIIRAGSKSLKTSYRFAMMVSCVCARAHHPFLFDQRKKGRLIR
jgi:hypothetical protein